MIKKSLGQHFLLDPRIIEKILSIAQIAPADKVLEIGSGRGLMTERIAQKGAHVVAIEKDRDLIPTLHKKLNPFLHLTLIEADFLELDLERTLGAGKWKVVANLPYNIATEAVFKLLGSSYLFSSLHLMVQREVANRFVAGPGSKDYGLLAIFTQIFSKNRIVLKLPPGAFTPPPKVDSAVVEFQIADGIRYPINHLPTFEKVVQTAFGQRRKMISNSLKKLGLVDPTLHQALEKAGIPPTARPEQLPIEKFVALANQLVDRGLTLG